MKLLVLFCLLTMFNESYTQWLEIEDSLTLNQISASLALTKDNELFFAETGSINLCDLLYKNTDTSNYKVEYFVRKDLLDHLFFHVSYADGREIYGWFKKVQQHIDGELVFCWLEDLQWIYLNKDHVLDKISYFSNGIELSEIPESISH